MKKTFKNDLQTHIQNLGIKDKKFILDTPSQHPLDVYLHEAFIADNLYRIGSQRREAARDYIRDELADTIATINQMAISHGMTQNEELVNTGNYLLTIQAKRPSMKLDPVRLKTLLIRAGVSQNILDKAWDEASELQKPVDVFTVNTTGNGI